MGPFTAHRRLCQTVAEQPVIGRGVESRWWAGRWIGNGGCVVSQVLRGIRVVELAEGVSGPYTGKLLAGFGADVVKVEPPGGDVARQWGPFPDQPDPELGALHLHLGTNKRSIVADLAGSEGDRELVRRLIARADLVIESFPPGTLDGWGLGFDALLELNPRVVLTSITPFGQTGPYAHFKGEEIVYYAMGGAMSSTGVEEQEPVKLGGNIIQYQCGNLAATVSTAAIMAAQAGGGIHVDVSQFEAQTSSIDRRTTYLLNYAYTGRDAEREGTSRLTPAPIGIYPTAEGYVQIITIPVWIPRMLAAVDDPQLAEIYAPADWVTDPTVPDRSDEVLYPWLLSRSKQEVADTAQANRWAVTPVNQPREVVVDEHYRERGFFIDVDHPRAGTVRQPDAPLQMPDGWKIHRPAPLLGEHGDEVRAELDDQPPPETPSTDPPGGPSSGRPLPLAGVRVLDLTVVWAGPSCTLLLGDLGAEVIRFDNPWLFPSSTRGLMPRPPKEMMDALGLLGSCFPDLDPGERPWNRHAMFNVHARNKKGATLDLSKPLGRETFLRAVEKADIVVENNAAVTLPKLGLGWDELQRRNPGLIMLRMPPLGLDGPYRDYVGFGAHFEALSGLTAIRGYRNADPTTTTTSFHMDPASGAMGALAVLLALRRREHTGEGCLIELPQAENMLQHIGEYLIEGHRSGREFVQDGNRHPLRAPQGCYRCAGDDEWVVISVGSDEEWEGLVRAMGSPGWATNPDLGHKGGRREHHDEIDGHIEAWTTDQPAEAVFRACQAEGVPAGPVLKESACYRDPQLAARGFFRPNGSEDAGTHDYPGHLWQWTGPNLAWGPLMHMGADNEYVYRDILGLSDDEYEALAADGHLSLDYLDPDGRPA